MKRQPMSRAIIGAILLLRSPAGAAETVFFTLQTTYSDKDATNGNTVLLTWQETAASPGGVKIFRDGTLVETAPGLAAGQLPGRNSFALTQEPAGLHLYRAEASDGAVGEGALGNEEQTVITSPPMADAVINDRPGASPACIESSIGGACSIDGSWTNGGPLPNFVQVFLDGKFQFEQPGFDFNTTVGVTTSGDHCLEVAGISVNPDGLQGRYRSGSFRTCCSTQCGAPSCPPVEALLVCQIEYGPGDQDCSVAGRWMNGADYAAGLRGFLDGEPLGTLPADTELVFLRRLAPRRIALGIQALCGDPSGASEVRTGEIQLLVESPHKNPVDGRPTFTWSEINGGRTNVAWKNGDPSEFIDVYIAQDQNLLYADTLAGTTTSFEIAGTSRSDVPVLQFFLRKDGDCYGSELVTAERGAEVGRRFIPGLCNGAGESPDITSAVFGLGYLFTGGEVPPCLEACDSNGDDAFDLSDMVHLLNFLFLGGSPPDGWQIVGGNGRPACLAAAEGNDCAADHVACAP